MIAPPPVGRRLTSVPVRAAGRKVDLRLEVLDTGRRGRSGPGSCRAERGWHAPVRPGRSGPSAPRPARGPRPRRRRRRPGGARAPAHRAHLHGGRAAFFCLAPGERAAVLEKARCQTRATARTRWRPSAGIGDAVQPEVDGGLVELALGGAERAGAAEVDRGIRRWPDGRWRRSRPPRRTRGRGHLRHRRAGERREHDQDEGRHRVAGDASPAPGARPGNGRSASPSTMCGMTRSPWPARSRASGPRRPRSGPGGRRRAGSRRPR